MTKKRLCTWYDSVILSISDSFISSCDATRRFSFSSFVSNIRLIGWFGCQLLVLLLLLLLLLFLLSCWCLELRNSSYFDLAKIHSNNHRYFIECSFNEYLYFVDAVIFCMLFIWLLVLLVEVITQPWFCVICNVGTCSVGGFR